METYKYWVIGLPIWIYLFIKAYRETGQVHPLMAIIIIISTYGIFVWRREYKMEKEKEAIEQSQQAVWKEIKEMIYWIEW